MTTLTSKNPTDKTAGRRRDRRAYRAVLRQINRATAALYRTPEPGMRAAALTRLAELYADLADRHVPACGNTTDSDGRPVVDALRACADLAHLVAGIEGSTEPVVFHGPGMWRLLDAQPSEAAAEALTRLWDDFGASPDPWRRAELLEGPLYVTALPGAGSRAAALLQTIAETEREAARRAYGQTEGQARRRRLVEALPHPGLVMCALAFAGVVLTGSMPFVLVAAGALAYVQAWAWLGDRYAPDCDPADHLRGPAEHWGECSGELAEFCPACDPAYVPLVDADAVRAWLLGRWHALGYQARMLPRRRPRWSSWLRCKATGHRIGTAGHRRAHTPIITVLGRLSVARDGRSWEPCRPWWVWWLPPFPIVRTTRVDADDRAGRDDGGRSGGER